MYIQLGIPLFSMACKCKGFLRSCSEYVHGVPPPKVGVTLLQFICLWSVHTVNWTYELSPKKIIVSELASEDINMSWLIFDGSFTFGIHRLMSSSAGNKHAP